MLFEQLLSFVITTIVILFHDYYFRTNRITSYSKPKPNIKRDFKAIKKACKGVLTSSKFKIKLSQDYKEDSKEETKLVHKCIKRNWDLRWIDSNEVKVTIMYNDNNTVDDVINNLKLIMGNCDKLYDVYILDTPLDFDYSNLVSIMKEKHRLQITYIKKDEKKGVTVFDIKKIKDNVELI